MYVSIPYIHSKWMYVPDPTGVTAGTPPSELKMRLVILPGLGLHVLSGPGGSTAVPGIPVAPRGEGFPLPERRSIQDADGRTKTLACGSVVVMSRPANT
jgi:hypothetical protein